VYSASCVCVCGLCVCVLRPFIKSRRKRRKKIILFRWFSVSTIFGGPVFLLFISRCGPFIGNLLYKSSSERERRKSLFFFLLFLFCNATTTTTTATTAHRRHTSQTVVGAHLRFLMDPGRFFERIYLVAVPSLFFSFFLFIFFFCGWTRCQINTNPSREREKRERE
jgi:hypothetical protein